MVDVKEENLHKRKFELESKVNKLTSFIKITTFFICIFVHNVKGFKSSCCFVRSLSSLSECDRKKTLMTKKSNTILAVPLQKRCIFLPEIGGSKDWASHFKSGFFCHFSQTLIKYSAGFDSGALNQLKQMAKEQESLYPPWCHCIYGESTF